MKGRALFAVSVLMFAGCTIGPGRRVPDGTYLEETDRSAVLVFDGDEALVQTGAAQDRGPVSWIGRSCHYSLSKAGDLHFTGTSVEAHYLFEMNRGCRWNGTAIECRGRDGNSRTYLRPPADAVMPPATEEQRVWLAAATHVLANESAGTSNPGPLVVRSRTSFPRRTTVSQLRKNAKQEFCGQSSEDARSIIFILNRAGGRGRSIRDLFVNRPEFSLTDNLPKKGDSLGMSEVLFYRDAKNVQSAYLSVEISGRSGSIVKMENKAGSWQWADECATWVSW
jgi:hypothetical protein